MKIQFILLLKNNWLIRKFMDECLKFYSFNFRGRIKSRKITCQNLHDLKNISKVECSQIEISVVLPTYNHATYLQQAIESILSQSGVKVTLVIVNDGSTDNTRELLDTYQKNLNVHIVHQENKGLSAALNYGFSLVSDPLVTWTSADNIMLPGSLEFLGMALTQNPEIEMVYSDYRIVDDAGLPITKSRFRILDQDDVDSSIIRVCRLSNLAKYAPDNFIGPFFMFRKETLRRVGEHAELLGVEDYDYWLRVNNIGRISHVYNLEPLYEYRIHANSLSSVKSKIGTITKLRQLTLGISQ